MPSDMLEFEEPIVALQREIDALSILPRTDDHEREIDRLNRRLAAVRTEIYANLTPWQRVQLARHPNRPKALDYIRRLFTDFDEIHGDRHFADDHAIVTGMARYRGAPVLVVGHQKGGADTKEKIYRNFGYAKPEGYRKAIRTMRIAQKFFRPIVVFVDTPAAFPGIESEERGVAEAIAYNLREMATLEVPVVILITGEGGSGGALGIAIGDRVLIQEYAIYSVIPPEGCAAILYRDSGKKVEATEALKITAPDMVRFGIVDGVIPEPPGGAHNDHAAAADLLDSALSQTLAAIAGDPVETRLAKRYEKFRAMGQLGIDAAEDPAATR